MDKMGYFTAAEVAKMFNVNKMTLYRWEAKKLIPKARRHPMNNYRVYTQDDVEKIKKMVKV